MKINENCLAQEILLSFANALYKINVYSDNRKLSSELCV